MTVTINYKQQAAPGYTPRRPVTLHNVDKVVSKGPHTVELHLMFTDHRPTHDHVASVSVKPDTTEDGEYDGCPVCLCWAASNTLGLAAMLRSRGCSEATVRDVANSPEPHMAACHALGLDHTHPNIY